jgi:hypothetical protein
MDEIYTGPTGTGRYVPNLNDEVFDWDTGLWRVVGVDYSTGLSELSIYIPPKEADSIDHTDVLLGTGPGYQSETFRAYLDTSVMPHILAVDSRLRFYGTTNAYVKIFLGTNISDEGTVISAMYDQGGTLLGDSIPLELVAMPNDPINDNPGLDNLAVKTPMVGYTTTKMSDNEVVTVVAYDDAGHVTSIAKLLVKNTAFIRTSDASKKYVASIHLESPFLSTSDDTLLEYPINLPVEAMELRGVVTYSDGSRSILPVDGTKFALHGISNFVSTILGQQIPLVLTYYLSEEEYVYGASVGATKHISVPYTATTTNVDGSYTVKLFVAPVWVNAIEGYRLRWFLYNLDREEVFEVTQHVQLAANSRSFNPTEYGVMQNISVAVDMNKVNAKYTNYRHTQTIGIALLNQGNLDQENWNINYEPGQEIPYGENLRASLRFVNTNYWVLNLNSGFASKEQWLENVYYNAKPLTHPDFEVRPPEPNYFTIVMGNQRIECPIEQWNSDIVMPSGVNDGDVVLIEFFKRNAATDLQLGVGVLPVHQEMPADKK